MGITTKREEELIFVKGNDNSEGGVIKRQPHCDGKTGFTTKQDMEVAAQCLRNLKKMDGAQAVENLFHASHHLSAVLFQQPQHRKAHKMVKQLMEECGSREVDVLEISCPEIHHNLQLPIFAGKIALRALICSYQGKVGEASKLVFSLILSSSFHPNSLALLRWVVYWLSTNNKQAAMSNLLEEEERTSFLSFFITKVAYLEKLVGANNSQMGKSSASNEEVKIDLTHVEWKSLFSLLEILSADKYISSYSEGTWKVVSLALPKCFRNVLCNNVSKSRQVSMRFYKLRPNFNGLVQYAICCRELHLLEESKSLFIIGSEMDDESSSRCFLDVADICLLQQKYEESLSWYLKVPPDNKRIEWAKLHCLHVHALLQCQKYSSSLSVNELNSFEEEEKKYFQLWQHFKSLLLSSSLAKVVPPERVSWLANEHLKVLEQKAGWLSELAKKWSSSNNSNSNCNSNSPNLNAPVSQESILRVKKEEARICDTIVTLCMDLNPLGGREESMQKALVCASRAVEISNLVGNEAKFGCLQTLALVQQTLQQYPLALQTYQQALEVASKISSSEKLVALLQTMYNLSSLHKATSQFSPALETSSQAISLLRRCTHSPHFDQLLVQFLLLSCGIHFQEKCWHKVIPICKEAFSYISLHSNPKDYQVFALMLGKSYLQISKQNASKVVECTTLYEEDGEMEDDESVDSCFTEKKSCVAYVHNSNLQNAHSNSASQANSFSSSPVSSATFNHNPALLTSASTINTLSSEENSLTESVDSQNQLSMAIQILESAVPNNQIGDASTRGDIYSVLVECYSVQSNLQKMILYQQLCNHSDFQLRNYDSLASGLFNIALMYSQVRDFEKAQRSFKTAIDVSNSVDRTDISQKAEYYIQKISNMKVTPEEQNSTRNQRTPVNFDKHNNLFEK